MYTSFEPHIFRGQSFAVPIYWIPYLQYLTYLVIWGIFKILCFVPQTKTDMCYAWLPNLVAAMLAYFMADIFLSLYAVSHCLPIKWAKNLLKVYKTKIKLVIIMHSWLVYYKMFQMLIDTMLICFCLDLKDNDGLEKPYYMSKSLMVSAVPSSLDDTRHQKSYSVF